MGNLDDEFEKIIEGSHLENLGSEFSSLSIEYLVASISQCSRTIALLTELLQASYEHYSRKGPEDERPGLTSDQVRFLMAFFESSTSFNLTILDEDEEEEDEDE